MWSPFKKAQNIPVFIIMANKSGKLLTFKGDYRIIGNSR